MFINLHIKRITPAIKQMGFPVTKKGLNFNPFSCLFMVSKFLSYFAVFYSISKVDYEAYCHPAQ